MTSKEKNAEIVEQVIDLLKQIEIEGSGHEQGYIFIFGQNDEQRLLIRGTSGGCPNCVTPTLSAGAMKEDPYLANAIPRAMAEFIKSKLDDSDGIKLQKGQEN